MMSDRNNKHMRDFVEIHSETMALTGRVLLEFARHLDFQADQKLANYFYRRALQHGNALQDLRARLGIVDRPLEPNLNTGAPTQSAR